MSKSITRFEPVTNASTKENEFEPASKKPVQPPQHDTPRCVLLFDALGSEWTYLPYDIDTIYQRVMCEMPDSSGPLTAKKAQRSIRTSTGISLPDSVVEMAQQRIDRLHSPSDSDVLLSLMACHAKLIRDDEVPGDIQSMATTVNKQAEINRTFIMVRALRLRTEATIHHFGSTLKNTLTQSKNNAKSLIN